MNDKKQNGIEEIATRATRSVGSPWSIIIHTALFAAFFVLGFVGVDWDTILLVLTTVVSLEAIYLAIFIQMTVNQNTQSLHEVETDIDVIQREVEEVEEHVGEIREDVEEMEEHVGEIREDMEELQEDVEEITEDDKEDDSRDLATSQALDRIQQSLARLMEDVERLKQGK